jgi:MFS family permease
MIADMTTPDIRGAAFGLRQSLDTIGAVIGPLVAIALMALTLNNFTVVFWVAVVPAVLAAALVMFAVREPERATASAGHDRMRLADLVSGMGQLPALYWVGLAVASVLTLARFSEAFLILKAQQTGVAIALLPAVLVVMNVVYAGLAFPAGRLSDRLGRIGILAAGTGVLVLADLVLALANGPLMLGLGVVLWGAHMALTQSLFAALVADTVPAALRGTGFGLLNFATGIALFAASVVAGALWTAYGAEATFLAGAAIAVVGLIGLTLLPKPKRPRAALP